jgi:hypothetical protein
MARLPRALTLLAAVSVVSAGARSQQAVRSTDAAAHLHQRGVNYHLRRCLDEASREYARVLELDPPRDLTPDQLALVRRFMPRVYTTPAEFFPLKDFAVILHPDRRIIAYHFFWEDDIDFPEDNDPCDHELMWVQYSPDTRAIEKIWTYFHGRILAGADTALQDARQHQMRPRVNVQWGKHGSMPAGWEALTISADQGDSERHYLPLDQPLTLLKYNEGAFRKLADEGRRLSAHPIGQRLGWPVRFSGTWKDFVDFSRPADPIALLDKTRMAKVSRWNSATINQHLLTYNFRPKTEWPVEDRAVSGPAARSTDLLGCLTARTNPGVKIGACRALDFIVASHSAVTRLESSASSPSIIVTTCWPTSRNTSRRP